MATNMATRSSELLFNSLYITHVEINSLLLLIIWVFPSVTLIYTG